MIVHDGLRRMLAEQEDVFYYLTVLNENYEHPAMPEGAEEGIIKGMYLLKPARKPRRPRAHKVQLMGSGAILREVIAGADLLEKDFGISADIWSVTSFTELAREAHDVERWNLLNPEETPRVPYVTQQLAERGDGPVIASTDYMKHVRRTDPAVRSRQTIACSAPTASAARTIAEAAVSTSRSIATSWRSRR